jgi:predicted nuclease of predicted toxin-antitoxin system
MRSLASGLRPIAAGLSSAPRVYADANVPAELILAMRRQLHWDALSVMDDATLRRARDAEHFSLARDLGRTLVTLDRDFLDRARFPPEGGPGALVLSAPDVRGLLRLLRYADRELLRSPDGLAPAPLAGRTIELTPAVLHSDSDVPRRRRRRPARSRRGR